MLTDNKLYYTIREVEKITNIPQHTLRLWEDEFKLNVIRHNSRRKYTPENLHTIKLIQHYKSIGLKNTAIANKLYSGKSYKIKDIQQQLIALKEDLQSIRKHLAEQIKLKTDNE